MLSWGVRAVTASITPANKPAKVLVFNSMHLFFICMLNIITHALSLSKSKLYVSVNFLDGNFNRLSHFYSKKTVRPICIARTVYILLKLSSRHDQGNYSSIYPYCRYQ